MAIVLTNVGKAALADKLTNLTTADFKWVAWGTGAGTAAATDTTLFTEGPESRVSGTKSRVTSVSTNDTSQIVATITASAGRDVTNSGVFDASTSGNMFCKADFATQHVDAGGQIEFTWQAQFDQG